MVPVLHWRWCCLNSPAVCTGARCTVWLTLPPVSCRYANSGSLFSHVQRNVRLPEAEARWYFQQIVLAVDYCHRKEIANRDIKLENTLLHREEGQVGVGEEGCGLRAGAPGLLGPGAGPCSCVLVWVLLAVRGCASAS